MAKIKYTLALLLAVVMLLSAVACTGNTSDPETTTAHNKNPGGEESGDAETTVGESDETTAEDDYVEPDAIVEFTSESDLSKCLGLDNLNCFFSVADGAMCMVPKAAGRCCFLVETENLDVTDYTYVALRVKVTGDKSAGAFFTACEASEFDIVTSDGLYLEKKLNYMDTDDWQTVVLNYKVGNGSDDDIDRLFSGLVDYFRIDPWLSGDGTGGFYLNSIGFYKDKKAATKFRGVTGAEQKPLTEEDISVTLANGETSILLGDTGELLTNPGMGWNFAYHSNNLYIFANTLKNGDTLDTFPCDIVYLRLGWADIEKSEGEYDWTPIDKPADEWCAKGKRIAVRICAAFPQHQNTPLWVKEAGAEGADRDDGTWLAYYDDPVFLEKLENFISVLAEHLKKYNVEFLDVGTLGSWGEGHSLETDEAKITTDMKINHMKLWQKYFPDTLILAGDDMLKKGISYKPNGAPYNPYDTEALNYAVNNGFGMFDDSIQVGMTETWNGYRGNIEMAEKFWKTLPVSAETHPGTIPTENYLDAVNNMHASYARIHADPYSIQYNPFTRAITLRLGYRLVAEKINITGFASDSVAEFNIVMKNYGAAPCYNGGYVKITVKDKDGKTVGNGTSVFNVKNLDVGASLAETKSSDVKVAVDLDTLTEGEYRVYISVVDSFGDPLYNLPVGISQGDKTYLVGVINYK